MIFNEMNKHIINSKTEIQILFDQLDFMRQRQAIAYVQGMLQASQEFNTTQKGD